MFKKKNKSEISVRPCVPSQIIYKINSLGTLTINEIIEAHIVLSKSLALATKHQNFYISPDIYCFFPGGELYVNAITSLQDQFIYASAYPTAGLKESVDRQMKFALSKEVMQKYMYGNAARLLKVES